MHSLVPGSRRPDAGYGAAGTAPQQPSLGEQLWTKDLNIFLQYFFPVRILLVNLGAVDRWRTA